MRWLIRIGMTIAGLLAGGIWSGCATPAYGVDTLYGPFFPPKPHDPTVALLDFSYTPAGPTEPGTTIQFSATTNKPTDAGRVDVRVADPPWTYVLLRDNGEAPDLAAGDGVWTGEYLVKDSAPAGSVPLAALLRWDDGYPGTELSGTPLTIIEPEDGE